MFKLKNQPMDVRYKHLKNHYHDNILTDSENTVYHIMDCQLTKEKTSKAAIHDSLMSSNRVRDSFLYMVKNIDKAPFNTHAEQRQLVSVYKRQKLDLKMAEAEVLRRGEIFNILRSKLMEAVAAMRTDSCDKFQEKYPEYFDEDFQQELLNIRNYEAVGEEQC